MNINIIKKNLISFKQKGINNPFFGKKVKQDWKYKKVFI